jgi:hypothetical protein
MAKAHETWKVLPHRPIEHLTDNLWRVEGRLENMALKRVMTVARRVDGGLVVHNAIALDDAAMAELDAWGPVTALLVPNGYHRLDARVFKQRYPAARVYCPRGATRKVAEVVPVDGSYADFPADATIELHTLAGVKEQEGVMLVRSADGATLVFNDAIFNMPHGRGFAGWIFRHVTQSTGGPRVSRLFRLGILKDKSAFRADLERLADTPELRRMIVSHHHMVEGIPDAAAAIRQAAATL